MMIIICFLLSSPEPPTPDSTESPVANKPVTALKSFTVEFSPTVFSHCNGEINNYTVIVVESGGKKPIFLFFYMTMQKNKQKKQTCIWFVI